MGTVFFRKYRAVSMFCNMLFLIFFLISCANSFEILGIFPYAGESHFSVFEPIITKLVEKGHNVTIISYYPLKSLPFKYNHIKLTSNLNVNSKNIIDIDSSFKINMLDITLVSRFGYATCDNLNHSLILNLVNDFKNSFDVTIMEHFNTDCFLGLVHELNTPLIGISSHIIMPFHVDRIGSVDSPSYVPNHFIGQSDTMSFFGRLENTMAYLLHKIIYYFLIQKHSDNVIESAFGKGLPSVRDISKNISMMFLNTHHSISRPRPKVPGMLEIGGVHLQKVKPLPEDIRNWIESSKDGVIYFSMGSMIKGYTLPEDKRKAFLQAFSRLGQRVLWKWENDTMPGKSNNVMIKKWMPQFDILCHPKVKAFISHGGLLGITEAVHCGVPVVVMPQLGDQHANAKALEASEGGVILNFHDVDEDTVYNALKTVLDPEYTNRLKVLRNRFHDRPLSALETAIYGIEYVAKYKGAPHLKIAAVEMSFYEDFLLDVILFIIMCLTFFLFTMRSAIKYVIYIMKPEK